MFLEREFDQQFPTKSAISAGFGVYVHVPFCSKRCDYCAFATWDNKMDLVDDYVTACVQEAERKKLAGVTSLFFGGGTPSLLSPNQVREVIQQMELSENAEVTLECNPETLTAEKLSGYREAGINRLSFGVQSFVPRVLQSLGRQHDAKHAVSAIKTARKVGFDSINFDLIYGAHGESLNDWRRSLEQTVDLEPDHVSAYALTVELGTPLALDKQRHPHDDDLAEKYTLTNKILGNAGFTNYEISNWAKPGHACQHNLLYWAQGNYEAIGCAAHGHRNGRRFWNVRTPEIYISSMATEDSAIDGEEILTEPQRSFEADELSLRTRWGIAADGIEDKDKQLLGDLLYEEGERIYLSEEGRFLANEVAMHLKSGQLV